MIEIKRDFSQRELLWFGPLFALFGGMVGTIVSLKFGHTGLVRGIWLGSLGLIALYYLLPPARKVIFTGWLMAFYPVGWVLSHFLLTLVFYGVVFPIGLLTRLFRYDALSRHLDHETKSYWIPTETRQDLRRYFRQF